MVILDGKKIQNENLEELKAKVELLDRKPGLAVIQVGNDEASNIYVKQKEKKALALGYNFVHKNFLESVNESELLACIEELNNSLEVDGIIVQMPLPKHLDAIKLQNSINAEKDIDGLSFVNSGKLIQNKATLVACTPKGIIDLLDKYNIKLDGANVVIVGRSNLVGKPLASLLINRDATVTICHSKTKDVSNYTKLADIVVVAIGKKGFLTADMVKDNAIVIDVGISRVDGKLYGDVDFENVSKKASYITPVPGGVGPMTVYELMNNVYEAYLLNNK